MSVSEASKYAGYSREMIEYWMRRGDLPYEQPPTPGKKNRFRRIRKQDLDDFLSACYRRAVQGEGRACEADREILVLLPKRSFTSKRREDYNTTCGSHAASR